MPNFDVMKRASILRAMQSNYYIPTIILVLFLVYLATLIILFQRKSEEIRLHPQAEIENRMIHKKVTK